MLSKFLTKIYYGWIITLVGLLVVTMVYGCKFCFGTLFGSLIDEFAWSRVMITSIFSVSILAQALLQPMGGALLDKFGPRRMLITGGILMGLSLITFGRSVTLWRIYISYGILFSLATVVAGFVTNTTMVSRWFEKKRGIAIGIVAAGSSLGLFIFNPLLAYLIKLFGWRIAMQFLGILTMVLICLVVVCFSKDCPEDVGQTIDRERLATNNNVFQVGKGKHSPKNIKDWSFGQALKTREFWLLCIAYTGYLFAWYSISNHLVMAMCDMGLDNIKAASIFGYTGLSGAIAGLVCAWIADYMCDRKFMVIIAYLLIGLGVFLFSCSSGQLGLLYLIVIILGIGHGGAVLMSAVVADRFGVFSMGKIWGTISMAGLLGGAAGPIVVGYIYDITGSYHLSWLMITLIASNSLICMVGVRTTPSLIRFVSQTINTKEAYGK